MKYIKLIALLTLMCLVPTVLAQVDCPAIVKAALDAVDASCADTSRNQLCYGNITLTATPREGVSSLAFEKAGDRASVTDIQALQLSSMSLTDDSWGVALMQVQANLPDTLPGQNVTFLLFGDVQIDNAAADATEVSLTTTGAVNVRLRPSTSGGIMTSLKSGENVIATGRLADSSWMRIKVEGDARGTGWVSADFLRGDLSKLAVVEPNVPTWGPMQAFYFKTGVGDRPCAEAPDSGILIQTPKGSGKVTLNVNDVQISLGSTVYLQAQPNNPMTVTVIEGQATLQTNGQTQIVPAGTYSTVQLDAAGKATGSPASPKPYDDKALQTLPLGVSVFTPISIATPLTTAQITAAVQAAQVTPTPAGVVAYEGGSVSGSTRWHQDELVTFNTCPGPLSVGDTNSWNPNIVFSADGQSFTYDGGPNQSTVTLGRTGGNTFGGQFGEEAFTFNFTSPTSYTFSWVGIHGDPNNGGCKFVMDANAILVSGG